MLEVAGQQSWPEGHSQGLSLHEAGPLLVEVPQAITAMKASENRRPGTPDRTRIRIHEGAAAPPPALPRLRPPWYAPLMRSFLLPLFLLAAAACSSSSSSSGSGSDASTAPCNENPWECPSGQTCWPVTATSFQCLNAGPGTVGSTCANTVGSATCGAGLACFQAIGASSGSCYTYCSNTDVMHACTGQDTCAAVELGGTGGPTFNICIPPMTNPDSGTSDSGPAADTGTAPSEAGAGDSATTD